MVKESVLPILIYRFIKQVLSKSLGLPCGQTEKLVMTSDVGKMKKFHISLGIIKLDYNQKQFDILKVNMQLP